MKRNNKIDGISIRNFVNYYLGAEHECSKLKHQGLKSFNNPFVIGVANDFAYKYPDCMMRQELLVVIDDYGNPGTYINPNNIRKLIELEICKEKLKLLENISCYDFDEAALLYQIWMNITKDIKYLESLYSGTYDLLYLVNKNKLLRSIKRHAKEEAKRTLIFTKVKKNLEVEELVMSYNEKEIDNSIVNENDVSLIDSSLDDYQVTEKVNRQKRLNYIKK